MRGRGLKHLCAHHAGTQSVPVLHLGLEGQRSGWGYPKSMSIDIFLFLGTPQKNYKSRPCAWDCFICPSHLIRLHFGKFWPCYYHSTDKRLKKAYICDSGWFFNSKICISPWMWSFKFGPPIKGAFLVGE